ncbi:hypothetical protein GM3708_794 [Geminocystis sp. NIES-3708]|uniref:hypothetical protein n=1 Tax=Geminocystis sp. NIES-3708 TaxID=1615909 RepID=UPI0005FC475A|nr:hypothetical protein [Geminocystis sp. NIES-3708]BAQ60388.1 hypothetical protein GM3708_794 [Geminocystis sp. NIES-3708]
MEYTIINITKEESKYAESNGEVYGVIKRLGMNISVYVELGRERPYHSNSNDDINTEYKFFSGCEVTCFKNEEDLANWSNGVEIRPIQFLTNHNVKICF